MYYSGALRIKEFGKNSASRKARKNHQIKLAEEIEARCLKEHLAIIDEGYIYAPGCGRFREEICNCSKCRKRNKLV
jgi:hypothetical protein